MNISKDNISNIFSLGKNCFNSNLLNVCYGVDKSFLFGAAISMQSIVLNNRALNFSFHIFTDYIDEDYKLRIDKFCQKNQNINVNIYVVSHELVAIFPAAKQWSYATFFRFIAFEYLADTCNNLLYIDADIICKGPINELLDLKLNDGLYAAVVKDSLFMQESATERLNTPGLTGNYFNAGFIYLNTQQWAKNKFMEKALSMLASDINNTKYKCLDQDILNILFFDHCLFLDDKFDKLYGVDSELCFKSDQEYLKHIRNDTRLIHYVGITKPWHCWANYPSAQFFYDAYLSSVWNDVALLNAKGEAQFKARSRHDKKNGRKISAFVYFVKYRIVKTSRKIKMIFNLI